VLARLRVFCEVHVLWWLEVLSLLKVLDVAIPSTHSARRHLRDNQPAHVDADLARAIDQALRYLNGLERFVLTFFEPIKAHPSHIYSSALPFSPVNDAFSAMHNAEAKASLQVIVGRDSDWGNCLRTIEGHGDRVQSVACSKDGAHIVSGSSDKTVRLWDATTGVELARFDGHTAEVMAVAFSSDGTLVASGSYDNTVRIWRVSTGIELFRLQGHSDRVTSVAFSNDSSRIASGSHDAAVIVWDMRSGAEVAKFTGHSSAVTSVAFSSDCTLLASGSNDASIIIWNLATSAWLHRIWGSRVNSVAFADDGYRVISGVEHSPTRGGINVWDAASSFRTLSVWDRTGGAVTSVALTSRGRVSIIDLHQCAAYGSSDRSVSIWDLTTNTLVAKLTGHSEAVTSVAFSADGTRLISGSRDKTIRVWDSSVLTNDTRPPPVHEGLVGCIAFSRDGSLIASGSHNKTARVQTTSGNIITLKGHTGRVFSVAFSSDSSKIVTGSDDSAARVWDSFTGRAIVILTGHTNWVRAAVFTPDGTHVVSASDDRTVRIWNWDLDSRMFKFRILVGHTDLVKTVAVSCDGTKIVSGSTDKSVRVWDYSTGEKIRELEGQSGSVDSVAFSADGAQIVCATRDKIVRVWNARTGSLISEVEGVPSMVPSIATGQLQYIARGPWITRAAGDGTYKRIAWLPADCRAKSQASHGQRMEIGTSYGKLVVLDFSNVSS
jgi:WD40 repeat protein